MAKLYELTQNYQNLVDILDNQEVPQEVIEAALNELSEDIDTKSENIAKVIKSIEIDVKGLKEEEQRLSDRRKSLENRIVNLKTYIEQSMKLIGKEKIKGKVFTLAIQKNAPSVDVVNEKAIPKKYFIVTKEIAKKTILEALKAGIKVPGAAIKQTESLRIR